MKVQLVKPRPHIHREEQKRQPDESEITETVQSWVKEFKSRKSEPRSLVIQQLPNPTRS
jgi:hypothetical protein